MHILELIVKIELDTGRLLSSFGSKYNPWKFLWLLIVCYLQKNLHSWTEKKLHDGLEFSCSQWIDFF
jgi:hypothetical protein